jgi:hypothetical protein
MRSISATEATDRGSGVRTRREGRQKDSSEGSTAILDEEGRDVATEDYNVFALLMVLTLVTTLVAFADLGPLNTIVALTIAVGKAVLVVLFFMHVSGDHEGWIPGPNTRSLEPSALMTRISTEPPPTAPLLDE